jgi:DNA-directed RNA polymerase subunit RPC12/RpoP
MKVSIGADCPHCGKPQTYSLASPDTFFCDACHYTAPHPPAVSAQLRDAARSLSAIDAREKQLGAGQRRALRLSGWVFGLYLAFVLLLIFPILFSAGCTCVYAVDKNVMASLIFGLPSVIVPLAALVGGVVLYRTRSRLLEQSSALPPLAPGETARCRACGAPVTETGRHLIVRCAFCGTDNLVDPRVLGWLRTRVQHTNHAVSMMEQRGALAVGTGVLGLVVLPVFSLAVPVVLGVVVLSFWAFVVDTIENPADLKTRYVLEEVPAVQLRCYGVVNEEKTELNFGFPPREAGLESLPHIRKFAAGEAPASSDVRSLIGQRILIGDRGSKPLRERVARVVRVYRAPTSQGNSVVLVDDQGYEIRRDLWPAAGANFACVAD